VQLCNKGGIGNQALKTATAHFDCDNNLWLISRLQIAVRFLKREATRRTALYYRMRCPYAYNYVIDAEYSEEHNRTFCVTSHRPSACRRCASPLPRCYVATRPLPVCDITQEYPGIQNGGTEHRSGPRGSTPTEPTSLLGRPGRQGFRMVHHQRETALAMGIIRVVDDVPVQMGESGRRGGLRYLRDGWNPPEERDAGSGFWGRGRRGRIPGGVGRERECHSISESYAACLEHDFRVCSS